MARNNSWDRNSLLQYLLGFRCVHDLQVLDLNEFLPRMPFDYLLHTCCLSATFEDLILHNVNK
jgi:hypothetical protein